MSEKPPFTNPVKEYTQERYIFDVKGKEILDYKYVYKYNENNKIVEIHDYNKEKLAGISYYLYDKYQNISEVIVKTAKGNKKQQITYEYQGNKLVEVNNKTKYYRTITKYDDFNNPVEEWFFKDANTPPYITKYNNSYNKNRQIILKQKLVPVEELDSTIKYQYDDDGLIIEQNTTYEKTSLIINGRELKSSKNSIVKHSYNDRGDLIFSEFHSDKFGDEFHKKDITYSECGDIVQICDYRKGNVYVDKDHFGLLSVTKYTYVR